MSEGGNRFFELEPVVCACTKEPVVCCYGLCCGPCFAYQLRKDVLGASWEKDYRCCQNFIAAALDRPSCVFCEGPAQRHPALCMCLESFCLFGPSISGSRFHYGQRTNRNDRPIEERIGLCIAVLSFCGFIGNAWGAAFDSCLGAQLDHQMTKDGVPASRCIHS